MGNFLIKESNLSIFFLKTSHYQIFQNIERCSSPLHMANYGPKPIVHYHTTLINYKPNYLNYFLMLKPLNIQNKAIEPLFSKKQIVKK